ncbi:MAG: UDP-glucose 4-epimerase GalE [bacterium]|nr:UDP-glucose 4-epimerase GalE [bacterium]
MRIGVTGGAGYIGSHIVQDLLEEGHEVVVIDNLSTANEANILNREGAGPAGYSFIEGDVGTDAGLAAFFAAGPLEVVFHFAAWKAAGESMTAPEKYSANNLRGTLRLIEGMLEHGCRDFIFSSSAAVYGEPQYLPIDEKHPKQPINYYGFTKLVIEQNLEWFARLRGLRFAALRYFNAAGYDLRGRVRGIERNPANLLPLLMDCAVGTRSEIQVFGQDYDTPDGTCLRDYIHVNDLSRAHILAMHAIRKNDESLTVNLGSEEELSVQQMLDVARKVTDKAIPQKNTERRPGDPPRLVASSALAREILDWRAEHSDPETLVQTMWDVYRDQS